MTSTIPDLIAPQKTYTASLKMFYDRQMQSFLLHRNCNYDPFKSKWKIVTQLSLNGLFLQRPSHLSTQLHCRRGRGTDIKDVGINEHNTNQSTAQPLPHDPRSCAAAWSGLVLILCHKLDYTIQQKLRYRPSIMLWFSFFKRAVLPAHNTRGKPNSSTPLPGFSRFRRHTGLLDMDGQRW